jgi:hypothetical protein
MNNFNKLYNNILEELFDKDVPDVPGKKIYQSLFHNKPGEDYDEDYSYEEEVTTEDVSYILSFMPLPTTTEDVNEMKEIKDVDEFMQIDIEFKLNNIFNEEKAKAKRHSVAETKAKMLIDTADALHAEIAKNPEYAEWESVQEGMYLFPGSDVEELAAILHQAVEPQKEVDRSEEIYKLLEPFTPNRKFIDEILAELDYLAYHSGAGSQSYYKNITSPKSLINLFAVIRKRLKDLLVYANWSTLPTDQDLYILAISFSGNNEDTSRVSLYNRLAKGLVQDLNNDEKTLPPYNRGKWRLNIESSRHSSYYNIFAQDLDIAK